MSTITLKGFGTTMERLDALAKSSPEALESAMMMLAEDIITDAVKRAPVQTGELRESAFVAPPSRELGGAFTIVAGFGADHAVEVHERAELPHPDGEAKFLERALMKKGVGSLHKIAGWAERYVAKGGAIRRTRYPTSPGGG